MATLQQQVQPLIDRTIKKGISIKTIAEKSDVSIRTVSRLRNGHTVSEVSALAVLNGLGVIWAERKEARLAKQETAKKLDATVEQLAAQCIDSDLTHVRDDALECGKQRRIAALEAEVSVVREQRNKLGFACEELTADLETEKRNFAALEQVHEQREQHLKSCENALIEANEKIARREACIEHLQKQLDYSNQKINELYATYDRQVDDEREMLAQIDTLFVERENAATLHDQQVIRLRVYVWSLIAALALVVVSGLVVWGGV